MIAAVALVSVVSLGWALVERWNLLDRLAWLETSLRTEVEAGNSTALAAARYRVERDRMAVEVNELRERVANSVPKTKVARTIRRTR